MSPTRAAEDVADFVWRTKYRAGDERGVADTWRRVAGAVASVEADAEGWAGRFYDILKAFRFLPGGRIQAGAGKDGGATLFNCFVLPGPGATVAGTFSALEDAVRTLRAGGGVGCDFSAVPPRGWPADPGPGSPGPLAMLDLWDAACRSFLSQSHRLGAMMGALDCRHPDIEAFAEAKRTPGTLSRFNLSVAVSDAFMAAVRAGADWELRFPVDAPEGGAGTRVSARTLWDRILRSAYETGEPGVLFVDRINRTNNLWWREHIAVTNPCGEVPLPDYGACNLGSLNLTRFVMEPFTPRARLDLDALTAVADVAVRFLDDVIDLSIFPLDAQARTARSTRRIGLGLTGLADALVMLGLRYGEPASLGLAAETMRAVRDAAYWASTDLAREKGAFPDFDRDRYLQGPFIRDLPDALRDAIAAHGIRNSHLLAIAPTGSISLLAGGISTGLEPIFAGTQSRAVRGPDGAPRRFSIVDPALAQWRALNGSEVGEPPGFVTAHDLPLKAHLDMQAALQPFVDNAISKTVNVAGDIDFGGFRAVYDQAFDLGLKGCTAFRARAGGLAPVFSDADSTCAPGCPG